MDGRQYPRHKVLTPVLVAIRTDEQVCVGTLLDISRSGLQMCVDWRRSKGLPRVGVTVRVEIQLDTQLVPGVGTIVRASGQRIGVSIEPLFEDSLLEVLMGNDYSYVRWTNTAAFVHGCVSHALSRDLLEAVRRGKEVDLRHATSLNPRALGTLQAVLQRGGTIANCSPILQTSISMATGLCAQCAGCAHVASKTAEGVRSQ